MYKFKNKKVIEITFITLISLGIVVFLTKIFQVDMLSNDAAQYISTARHMSRGEGISTSLIFYEQQRGKGIPAPQTVWPLGFPVIILIFNFLGIPFLYAPFAAALCFQILGIILFYYLLKMCCLNSFYAIGGAVFWASTIKQYQYVLMGLSEPAFIFFCLLGLMIFLEGQKLNSKIKLNMIGAGICASAGFLIRYAGIAYIFAFIVFLLIRTVFTRKSLWFKNLVLISIFPILTILVVFFRNIAYTGNIYENLLNRDISTFEIVQRLWWATNHIIGFSENNLIFKIANLILAAGIFIWVILILYHYFLKSHDLNNFPLEGTKIIKLERSVYNIQPVLFISSSYFLLTFIMLLKLSFEAGPDVFSDRYLLPVFPFIILSFSVLSSKIYLETSALIKRILNVCFFTIVILFICGQGVNAFNLPEKLKLEIKHSSIYSGLESFVEDETLIDFLKKKTTDGSAIIELNGQFLGAIIDRPVIGLAPPAYTNRIWNEEAVLELVKEYKVSLICFFPNAIDFSLTKYKNQIFFKNLSKGLVPDWLSPLIIKERFQIYVVNGKLLS